ncbi:MAG: MSHA biogenesis protein MshQ, partial [Polaribacter sp.]
LITSVTDSDGISSGPITLNPTGTDPIRFGRMRMYNANGSELSPLVMDYRLEYFDSGNWGLHDDMDSTIATGDITSNPAGTSGTSILATTLAGKFAITLAPPGTGNDKAYLITTDVFNSGEPWLQYDWDSDGNQDGSFDDNPSATATFGIYQGNTVNIYIQQTYQ